MKIRRFQYQINFIHIITFNYEYKDVVAPFFAMPNMQYAIENYGTLEESIRLVFPDNAVLIQISKEAIIFVFEGDVSELKKSHPMIEVFFDLYSRIKLLKGYTTTLRHSIKVHNVNITVDQESKVNDYANTYMKINPFNSLKEFACIYNFEKDDCIYNIQIGNFSNSDIAKYGISPFKTNFNSDLANGFGLMSDISITESDKNPSVSKMRNLLKKIEETASQITVL